MPAHGRLLGIAAERDQTRTVLLWRFRRFRTPPARAFPPPQREAHGTSGTSFSRPCVFQRFCAFAHFGSAGHCQERLDHLGGRLFATLRPSRSALANNSNNTLRALTLHLTTFPSTTTYPRNSRCAPRKLRIYHGCVQGAVKKTFVAVVRATHSSLQALYPNLTASSFRFPYFCKSRPYLHHAFHCSSPYPTPSATTRLRGVSP